jgi:hypothetical protein
VLKRDRAHLLQPLAAGLDPTVCPEHAVIVLGEGVAGEDVVVEQPAVIHDPRDQLDVVRARGVEHELAGPRLERVEDEHSQSISSP